MDLGPWLLSILLGLLVTETFKAIRSEWPLLYVDFTSIIDPIQRRSLSRWILFRTVPALLASAFLVVTLETWGSSLLGPTFVFVLSHLLSLYLFPLVRGLKNHNLSLRQTLLWVSSALLVVGSTSFSLLLRNEFSPFVPSPSEMIQVLWTGAFAAIGLAIATRVIDRGDGVMTDELISNSIKEVEQKFERNIEHAATLHGVDAVLLTAIAVTENIQRPAWFRRLENFTAHVRRVGTYGLMQVSSTDALSDEESITFSARDFYANTAQKYTEDRWEKILRLTELAKKHNKNPVFLEMLENVLNELVPWDEDPALGDE